MARASCPNCCRKHLGKAEALMSEVLNGHPDHAWLAVGQLSEAEDEIVCLYPAAAELIRQYRRQYEAGLDDGQYFAVPTLELITAITGYHRELVDRQKAEHPTLPDRVCPTCGAVLPGVPGEPAGPASAAP